MFNNSASKPSFTNQDPTLINPIVFGSTSQAVDSIPIFGNAIPTSRAVDTIPIFGNAIPTTRAVDTIPIFGAALQPKKTEHPITIAVDCEYNQVSDDKVNLLSVQFHLISEGQSCTLFKLAKNNKRPKFKACIQELIVKAIKENVLLGWPEKVIVCGHFLRADLLHFSNAFSDFEDKLTAVRKTIVSMESSYGIDVPLSKREHERNARDKALAHAKESQKIHYEKFNLYDENRHYHRVEVLFYDTILITPSGQSLSDVGELVGVPKVVIPKPYSIDKMDIFLKEQPETFEYYAMTDVEITVKFFISYYKFCKEEGLSGLPFTIGGVALGLYKKNIGKSLPDLFGLTHTTKEIMSSKTGKFITRKALVSIDEKLVSEEFVKATYHGGVNNSFQTGPTTIGTWTDIDAKSCYTTILNNIRTIDYDRTRMSTDLNDYLKDIMGFARVKFSFPKTCYNPTLPVRTDKYGLIYPLSGISWCTAHELIVAHSKGAEIEILQGFIIPWAHDCEYVFRDFMKVVRFKRNKYKGVNTFYEKLWKEIGNSLYGKLAQGLRSKKTGYDIFQQDNKTLPISAITNAYYASYTTGFARALMMEQINNISNGYDIVSVTTDGYCSNCPLSAVDINGPISTLFTQSFLAMDNLPNGSAEISNNPILEVKHQVRQVIAMKTRGQLTALAYNPDNPLLARAGVQVHINNPINDKASKREQNEEMLKLYLERKPGQLHLSKSLISTKEQFTNKSDLVGKEKMQRLNLEPDFKRNPCNPTMRKVLDTEHIHLDSKPFNTVEEMLFFRVRFDQWRKINCLKTLNDWDNWVEFSETQWAKRSTNLRLTPDAHSGHILLRLFLRAFVQSLLGLSGNEYTRKELINKFAEWDYPCTTGQFTAAIKEPLHTNCIPHTIKANKLAKGLKALFPKFEVQKLFVD